MRTETEMGVTRHEGEDPSSCRKQEGLAPRASAGSVGSAHTLTWHSQPLS